MLVTLYYHGEYNERFIRYNELEVGKRYTVRSISKMSNSNAHEFYGIQYPLKIKKMYRCELFKTLDEIRDEKINSIPNEI